MSKLKLSHINVLDIEATCWEGDPPTGELSEVIEFGVCKLMRNGTITDKLSILIKPTQSTISDFCTNLTGYTYNMLKSGIPFQDGLNVLVKNYGIKSHPIATWGQYDVRFIRQQCDRLGIECPITDHIINIKDLFALQHKLSKGVRLGTAIEMLGMEFVGKQHCGADDAYNTAIVLQSILEGNVWRKSFNGADL